MLGLDYLRHYHHEADDVIISLARHLKQKGGYRVFLLSNDKDFFPWAEELYTILDFDLGRIHLAGIEQRFQVPISSLVDFFTLVGDNSDNIRGVPGIGPMRARTLLSRFGSVANIIERAMDRGECCPSLRKVRKELPSLYLSRQLLSMEESIFHDNNLWLCWRDLSTSGQAFWGRMMGGFLREVSADFLFEKFSQ